MPEQIRCPSCNAALRVPESLLGKNVKCPKCQETFLAELEELAEEEAIVREPAPSAKRRRPPPPEELEEEEEELPQEDELEEEEEERPRRRKRRRRRTAAAEAAVTGPAISLIIIGSIDIVLVILDLALSLMGNNFLFGGGKGVDPRFAFLASPAFQIPNHILGLCFAATILLGGIKMKQLQSFGVAMTASILAMLPCGNCLCCIGLPLGIWALVVLNRPEVKGAFS